MFDSRQLILNLRSRGIRLWLEAGRPKLDPAELMRDEDWAALRANLAGFVAALQGEAQALALPDPDAGWQWRKVGNSYTWIRTALSPEDRRAALRDVRFHEKSTSLDHLICKPRVQVFRAAAQPCRSCKALVYWAKTKDGKSMPVDVEPSARGNIALVENEEGLFACYPSRERAFVEDLRTSHFATCPNAKRHSRKK